MVSFRNSDGEYSPVLVVLPQNDVHAGVVRLICFFGLPRLAEALCPPPKELPQNDVQSLSDNCVGSCPNCKANCNTEPGHNVGDSVPYARAGRELSRESAQKHMQWVLQLGTFFSGRGD